ncbi:MAG TPA: hypothetical protein VFY18_14950 [Candidatus Limnocylindrales bacterium]|nr:hypothetical protein [Candidatus Limnocylindrales bacterium]
MAVRLQTFLLAAPRPDVESACRRALRNVDWLELPTDTFTIESPAFIGGGGGGGSGPTSVVVELLIGILELIPQVRQRLTRLRTITRHAPPPAPRSDAVINAIWGKVVMVTISLRDQGDSGTEVTIAGQGGLPGKAAAVVTDLHHSIAIQSGSLTIER